ncbi:MAG: translation elongation factor Ts [Chloroflexia bacterium]
MEIPIATVKELRARTGAGVLDCRKALAETQGDIEAAVRLLREQGLAEAAKRSGREAREGRIECYVHHGNRIAAMVELNCETDFVARTENFIRLAHELAMQVAATNPRFLSKEEVPEAVLEEERAVYRSQIEGNKPPQVVERIVEGKLSKFFEEVCLLEQPSIREPERKVKDLVSELAAQVGENIVVRRFVRFELGA